MKKSLGVYIHVPFCVSKCAYCDFYSLPSGRGICRGTKEGSGENKCVANEADMRGYVGRLCRDIEKYAPRFTERSVDTVYFGGGTPTVLYDGAIYRILDALMREFSFLVNNEQGTVNSEQLEITSEANPESLTREKAEELKAAGVNRVSVGLQSANDSLLKTLGRAHSVRDFLRAMDNLRAAGFLNIGADMMLGLPGQTLRDVESTLDLLLKEGVKHISAYALKLERGTELYKRYHDRPAEFHPVRFASTPQEGNIMGQNVKLQLLIPHSSLLAEKVNNEQRTMNSEQLPGDDETADMYDLVYGTLNKRGFKRYEVSNFAVPGFECRHNLKYWTMGEYLGLGAAAHSFYGGARYANSRSLNYRTRKTVQTPLNDLNDTVMLGLRTEEGIDAESVKIKYGRDLPSDPAAADLIKRGFLVKTGNNIAIAPDKFYVMNSIIERLIK